MTPIEFERMLVDYQQRISPNSTLEHNKIIKGQSGTTNQCDAVMTFSLGGIDFLVIFECKYHNKKVDLPKLREFKCKVDEVGASKGVFVSKEGYTKQAKEFANFHNIELYTLIDYDFNKSKEILRIPVNITFIYPKSMHLKVFCALTDTLIDLKTIDSPDFDLVKEYGLIFNQKDNIWYTVQSFCEEVISKRFDEFIENEELCINEDYLFTPFDHIKTEERKFSIPLRPLKFRIKLDLLNEEYNTWVDIDKLIGFDNIKSKNAFTLQTKSFNIKDLFKEAKKSERSANTRFNLKVINKLLPSDRKENYKFILNNDGEISLV